MAARFWVGGTGTWDASTTTHWSATSGGAGGQSVPGAADDVTLDVSTGASNITTSSAPAIKTLTITSGYAGVLTGSLTVGGNVSLGGISSDLTGLDLTHSNGTLTSNGKTISSLSIGTAGTSTLGDDLALTIATTSTLSVNSTGSFNANNKNLRINALDASAANGRTITGGTGTWTITGGDPPLMIVDLSGSNLTVSMASANLLCTAGGDKSLNFGTNNSFNNFENRFSTGGGTMSVVAATAVTFADFKSSNTSNFPTHNIVFSSGVTFLCTSFTVNGVDSTKKCHISSSSSGSAFTLSDSSGTNTCRYLQIQDSAAVGGATWIASTSTDVSGNSGWLFQNAAGMLLVF